MSSGVRGGSTAFSLIEVTLAIGLTAFVLVALFGLMTVGINSSKASHEDTVIAFAARYVLSDLTQKTYPPSGTNYFFDYQGKAGQADAYYRCDVVIVPNPVPFRWAVKNTNAVGVKMTFTWPAQSRTKNNNAKIFWSSLSAY